MTGHYFFASVFPLCPSPAVDGEMEGKVRSVCLSVQDHLK